MEVLQRPIDYERVDGILAIYRERSIDFLRNVLK